MQRSTLEEFRRDPVGRYVVGSSWLYFCASPDLAGCVLWGYVTEKAVGELVAVAPATHSLAAKPHGGILDARRVERVDASAFARMQRYYTTHRESLTAVVKKLALVRPDGFLGAIAGGFFRVVPPPYPVEIFDRAGDAYAWLGAADAAIPEEIDALQDEAEGVAPIQRELRKVLAGELGASLADAAAALGMSVRTVQRRLTEAKTSFQAELAVARIQAAERMVSETDESLTAIAFAVGFASAGHFSGHFRRVCGVSPSEWRASRRARGT